MLTFFIYDVVDLLHNFVLLPSLFKVFLLLLFLLPSSTPHLVLENDEVWKKAKKRYWRSYVLHKEVSKKGRKCSIDEVLSKSHRYFPIEDKAHDLISNCKAIQIDVLKANTDILFQDSCRCGVFFFNLCQ